MADHLIEAHPNVRAIASSLIREVANAGLGKRDVLPFWFGEPDEPTPAFIRDAAKTAIDNVDTYYTHNYGIPELRAALAEYVSRLHGSTSVDELIVTGSGMAAIMLVSQALIGPGDRVVAVTPLWPNITSAPRLMGAQITRVPLAFKRGKDDYWQWTLDVDQLLDTLTADTRALYLNSPNNPTGWTIDWEAQRAVLAKCRRYGIWIVGDDVYERLYYDAPAGQPTIACAPSFLDLATREERVIATNSFSKNWLMTGWRLGWAVAPRALVPEIAKLIEFNTSCVPGFVQRAGLAAVNQGESVIERTVMRFRGARDFLVERLNAIDRVDAASPPGAMYAFFRVAGMRDSLRFCKRMVVDAGLGLAPGRAFGEEGEGFIRWCFAADHERLADGIERLRRGIKAAR